METEREQRGVACPVCVLREGEDALWVVATSSASGGKPIDGDALSLVKMPCLFFVFPVWMFFDFFDET